MRQITIILNVYLGPKMKWLLSFLFLIFFLSFTAGQSCDLIGQVNYSSNQYCNFDGWQNLKDTGVDCLNDYECKIGSCKEGICKSEFQGIQENQIWYKKILEALIFWQEEINNSCVVEGGYFGGGPLPPGEEPPIYSCCEGFSPIEFAEYENQNCYFQSESSVCANCGNGICGLGENYCNCIEDCSELIDCGDGICNITSGENSNNCLVDCYPNDVCVQDGICNQSNGENLENCPIDCFTLDFCGNSICGLNETCSNCSADCGPCGLGNFCGDGYCNSGETCQSCNDDCGNCPPVTSGGGGSSGSKKKNLVPIIDIPKTSCGNGVCESDEACSVCSSDCGECPIQLSYEFTCGDGVCDEGESTSSCPSDCKKSLFWIWVILILLILLILAGIAYVIYRKRHSSLGESSSEIPSKPSPISPQKDNLNNPNLKPRIPIQKDNLSIPPVSSPAKNRKF